MEGDDGGELIRRCRGPVLPGGDDVARALPWPLDRVGGDGRSLGGPEHELRDDSKVAATPAAARPVEVGVLPFAALEHPAVSGDDRQLLDRIAGEAELPRREAVASSEGEPGNSDCRARAGGNGHAGAIECFVDVEQASSGADPGRVRARDSDPRQPRDVHDEAARTRVTPVAVSARAGSDANSVLLRPAHRFGDVLCRLAIGDGKRPRPVEAGVEEESSRRVAGARTGDEVAIEAPRKGSQRPVGTRSCGERRQGAGAECESGRSCTAQQSAPVEGAVPSRWSPGLGTLGRGHWRSLATGSAPCP